MLDFHSEVLPELSVQGVLAALRRGAAENPMLPAGFDLSQMSCLGLVMDVPEPMLGAVPFSVYEEIAEGLKGETGGAPTYLGLYRQRATDAAGATVRMLCSSPALPASVASLLLEAEGEARPSQPTPGPPCQSPPPSGPVAEEDGSGSESGSSQVDALRRLVAQGGSLEAGQPGPPEAAPVPPTAPAAESSTGYASLARPPRAAGDSPSEETPADAYRERFERLASAFRCASDADDRRGIIGRELAAAQRSGEALERFYAVHAMARLDPHYFETALRAASRDEDPHVASLAKRALQEIA